MLDTWCLGGTRFCRLPANRPRSEPLFHRGFNRTCCRELRQNCSDMYLTCGALQAASVAVQRARFGETRLHCAVDLFRRADIMPHSIDRSAISPKGLDQPVTRDDDLALVREYTKNESL